MKKFLFVLLLSLASQAHALIINDTDQFGFGGFTWDAFIVGDGFGDLDTVTDTLSLTSSNDGLGFGTTDMSTTSLVAGIIDFSWSYMTSDTFLDPAFDAFFSFVGADFLSLTYTAVSDDNGAISQFGMGSIRVTEDDLFGFNIDSLDSFGGSATASIFDFSFTADGTGGQPGGTVPEPSIFALFGLGLVGLGLVRRRRQFKS